jgi:hypothetical protein
MRKFLLLVLLLGCKQPAPPPSRPPPPPSPPAVDAAVEAPPLQVDAGPADAGILLFADDGGIVEQEPNDTAQPQRVELPLLVKGLIWPQKDVDVYRFHVAADHAPVSIVLSRVQGVDLMLRLVQLHGDSPEVIGTSDRVRGEGEEKLLSVPLKEGDYAVEVSSPRNRDASATLPYTLSVK